MELPEEAEDDGRPVACEMEAAEALAGLACRSAELRCSSQDQAIAAQQDCGTTPTMVTCAFVSEEMVRIAPSQLRCTVESTSKVRQNCREAEKEARRLHRVLANRESARQTIRRRQAMHMELIEKVASLFEENKNLKKEKALAVKDYDFLRGQNEFLKLQIANKFKTEPRRREEGTKSSGAERASSATMRTPTIIYKHQPSLVRFIWPSIPYPNVFQMQHQNEFNMLVPVHFQVANKFKAEPRRREEEMKWSGAEWASSATMGTPTIIYKHHPSLVPFIWPSIPYPNVFQMQNLPHSNLSSPLHFPIPLHRGQEISVQNAGTRNQSFVLPVHWLVPFLNLCSASNCLADANERPDGTLSAHQCSKSSSVKDNHQSSSNPSTNMGASDSARTMSVRSVRGAGFTNIADSDEFSPSCGPTTHAQGDDNVVSAPEHVSHVSSKKLGSHCVPVDARRRRKELMQMKNAHYHHFPTGH